MRICIPTSHEGGLKASVYGHFGSAPAFTVIDTEQNEIEAIRNPSCHEHHGACHHIDILRAHAVDAVACQGIGRRALNGLNEAGIQVLVAKEARPAEIVESIRQGRLRPVRMDEACSGGHGHHGPGKGRGHRHGHGHGSGHA